MSEPPADFHPSLDREKRLRLMRERAQFLIERVLGKWIPPTYVMRRIANLIGPLLFAIGAIGFFGVAFSPGTPASLWDASGIAALPDGRVFVIIEKPPRIQFYDESGAFLDSRTMDSGNGMMRIRPNGATTVEVGVVRRREIVTFSSNGDLLDSRDATVDQIVDFPGRSHIASTNRGRQFRLTWHGIDKRIGEGPWQRFASDSFPRAFLGHGGLICVAGIGIIRLSRRYLASPSADNA